MTLQMLRGALEAFEGEDIDKARAVIAMDDRIDALESQMVSDVARRPRVAPELAARIVGLVLVARSIERMADHAVNICEEIFYWLEGEDIRHR